MGARSPSSRANGSAEVVIRPVTSATRTPRATTALIVATVRGGRRRSSPTSVPSRSRATSRIRRVVTPGAPRTARGVDHGDPGTPGEVGLDAGIPAGEPPGDCRVHRRTLVAADLEQGDPVRGEALGQDVEEAADDVEPVGARRRGRPTGSNEAATGRRGTTSDGMYGRLAQTTSNRAGTTRRPATRPAGASRSAVATATRSPTAWATAFSRARSTASSEVSEAKISTSPSIPRRRRATARATAIVPAPVPTSAIASGGVPGGPRGAGQPAADLAEREIDEHLRLRPRDQGPGVRRERDAVELLDAADVGDRLAGLPAQQRLGEAGCRLGPDGLLRVGDQGSPVHPQGVGQQQLRVQARALGAARAQATDRAA